MTELSRDRTLLAVGAVVVTVVVFLEMWVEVAGAILAYTVAEMLFAEHQEDQARQDQGRRASTYSRSVSTSASS